MSTLIYKNCTYLVLARSASRVVFTTHNYSELKAQDRTRTVWQCSAAAWDAGTPFSHVE